MEFKIVKKIGKKLVRDYTNLVNHVLQNPHSIGFPENQKESYYRKLLEDYINKDKSALLVVYDGKELVGTGYITLSTPGFEIRHFGTISKVMVHPTKRTKGIGNQIMSKLEAKAKNIGYTHLKLQTSDIPSIISFYKRCGYNLAGVIPEFILINGKYHDSHIFYKKL